MSLRAKGVEKNFAGLRALKGVDLEVRRGEIVGLIGPNGSGKTTLVNCLAGALRPNAGSISIGGLDVTGWDPDRISRAGLARTFQTVRLFGSLSVAENVQVAAVREPRAALDEEVAGLLDRLGLSRWAESQAGVLPYGVQRRLEIARALGTRPAFLLLDEPAAGLNHEESDELLDVIRGLKDDEAFGCGVLIIDHDLRLIMRLCERIHVLNEGTTIAEGAPEEVRRDPGVVEAYLGRRGTNPTEEEEEGEGGQRDG